jgi:mRNA interferase MazF
VGGVSRGEVVLAAMAGDYGKPRPWLVVQADQHNRADRPDSILVCPFTSHQEDLAYRVAVKLPYGSAERASWVMVDKLMAMKRERIRSVIARVSRQELAAVEVAMMDLLGLWAPNE